MASGSLAFIVGRCCEVIRCGWLCEVFNGNPEPDEPGDCYSLVECGATVTPHPDYPTEGWICRNGHDRLPYHIEHAPGGPAWQREMAEAGRERF